MAVTMAKVMFLDRRAKAYVVDVDEIRYDKSTLRDRLEFADETDFEASHNYYVKWRDCSSDCELVHVHSSYYPARILCMAGDPAALEEKSFRFPSIPFDEQDLSPMASQSSGVSSHERSQNDSEEEYSEFSDNHDESSRNNSSNEDELSPRSLQKNRKKDLAAAKLAIQNHNSLENVRKYRERHARRTLMEASSAAANGGAGNSANYPDRRSPLENDQPIAPVADDVQQNDLQQLTIDPQELRPIGQRNPLPPLGDNLVNEQNAGGNDQPIAPLPVNVQQNNLQPLQINHQNVRQMELENPPPPPVRRTRYAIVNDQYVINENLSIDVDTYEMMRMRPFKKANLFIRDTIGIVWSERELACRCLDLQKCNKRVPGLRLAEPHKIELVKDIVCNWYEDEKGIRMTEKKKDKVHAEVRRKLSDVIRDKKQQFYPDLVRRKRPLEEDGNEGEVVPRNEQVNGQAGVNP